MFLTKIKSPFSTLHFGYYALFIISLSLEKSDVQRYLSCFLMILYYTWINFLVSRKKKPPLFLKSNETLKTTKLRKLPNQLPNRKKKKRKKENILETKHFYRPYRLTSRALQPAEINALLAASWKRKIIPSSSRSPLLWAPRL